MYNGVYAKHQCLFYVLSYSVQCDVATRGDIGDMQIRLIREIESLHVRTRTHGDNVRSAAQSCNRESERARTHLQVSFVGFLEEHTGVFECH